MVDAARAPVRPRVRRDGGAEAFFLEDEVRDLLARGDARDVALVGTGGSGRTTALGHLAWLFQGEPRLWLTDAALPDGATQPEGIIDLHLGEEKPPRGERLVYHLLGWDDDDRLEYLLARAPRACASVLARLRDTGPALPVLSRPGPCVAVLDALAADETLRSPADALHRAVDRLGPPGYGDRISLRCLRETCGFRPAGRGAAWREELPADSPLGRLLHEEPVRRLLAARSLAQTFERGRAPPLRAQPMSLAWLPLVAEGLRGCRDATARLDDCLGRAPASWQPSIAGLCLQRDPTWRPRGKPPSHLAGAPLAGAAWRGIDLSRACLLAADLSGADLGEACLDRANAGRASFAGARLSGASLRHLQADHASFAGAVLSAACLDMANLDLADLSNVDAEGASFVTASMHGASLAGARLWTANLSDAILDHAVLAHAHLGHALAVGARLRHVDLREATLEGMNASQADLSSALLEGVEWPAAQLEGANLTGAMLTGARMPGARLAHATLQHAQLADVDLSGANLRGADLRHANFHMGSSRSGLLSSPIACEGSRTGYYVEDTLELSKIDPDSVRKADLRGADLRGAAIQGTDFFLVDLRGALIDPGALPGLRGMRAILDEAGEA